MSNNSTNTEEIVLEDNQILCVLTGEAKKSSPKDDFPLPHIDMLVDNTTKSNVFSFMEGFFDYNQIKMAPENTEKTTFIHRGEHYVIE